MKKIGLTHQEVMYRIENGKVNKNANDNTKSYKEIYRTNIITLFNILNLSLAFFVILVGSYKNVFFLGVVLCNTIIGIFQEIQAKKTIEKLSIIASTKVLALRDSKEIEINVDEIVEDDVIILSSGDQIAVDGIVIDGAGEVDESMLTGESNYIYKKEDDTVLSGSFVISGKLTIKVTKVGSDSYASSIINDISYIRENNSQIIRSLKKIIKYISFIIIPLGILIFKHQLNLTDNYETAVLGTVASLIGMIPEGLILLTSTVLMVGVIRLSSHKVLVQELYCIESLARVDTLCLDKTGTLTEGKMKVKEVILVDQKLNYINEVMGNLINTTVDDNPTMKGLKEYFEVHSNYNLEKSIPFSSLNKYSGSIFKEGTYLIGAYEYLFTSENKKIANIIDKYSEDYRVLVLVKKDIDIIPLSVILIEDVIRHNTEQTIKYFYDQGVNIKILSGDNAKTVAKIASRVGVKNADKYINYNENINNFDDYSVIGRIDPLGKKKIISSLKSNGHVVAMVGDGINDVQALKEADCSLAMASGASSARSVSQIVLLNSNFDAVPKIVLEGRRSINNLERSATLFLTKTIYTFLLSIIFLFLTVKYPFAPIQLSLTNIFIIGIPSFILALEKNDERVSGVFLLNVLRTSLPAAISIVINIMLVVILSMLLKLDPTHSSTLAVVIVGFSGFMLLYKISYPLNLLRTVLLVMMIIAFSIGFVGLRELLELTLTKYMIIIIPMLIAQTFFIFRLITNLFDNLLERFIAWKMGKK